MFPFFNYLRIRCDFCKVSGRQFTFFEHCTSLFYLTSNYSIRHRSLSKKREHVHTRRRSQSADRVLQAHQAGLIETYSSEGEVASEKEDKDDPSDPLQACSATAGSTNTRESPPSPTEPDSSLVQIFPAMYGQDYKELQLMDRTVEIFLQCLGVRGSLQMGNTQFRNFTRYIIIFLSLLQV